MTVIVDITTNRVGRTAVVTPHGDIDLVTSPEFHTAVHAAIDEGATALVIDLSDAGFLDSTALGVLVSAHRRLKDRLAIAAARPVVQRLFEVTQFTTVLRIYPTVDGALDDLRP
ncbi:STAS domain-containing protein [Virgisporangium ochraceum]|uniref:STAS domain-containing protein n=1 Tax=Virgisporangium ochraceum TaxID=65505 RepID=UPI00194250F1|nr:STAS domain-containing protein [Virgisporangium ochraceum]